jgi:hypothetical protein
LVERIIVFCLDVPVVLLQPGVNLQASLSNVDLTTFTGDAVYSHCLQSLGNLDSLKVTRNDPLRVVNQLDVVPGQHPANAVEY